MNGVVLFCSRSADNQDTLNLFQNLSFDYAALRSGWRNGSNIMPYVVYIIECSDGSYYTRSAPNLSHRLWQHEQGMVPSSYTYRRRPLKLVWISEESKNYSQALQWERQIKGWSRAKKKH